MCYAHLGPYVVQEIAKNRGTKINPKNLHFDFKFSDYSSYLALATGRRRPRRVQKMGERTALVPDGVAEVFCSIFVEICCVDN